MCEANVGVVEISGVWWRLAGRFLDLWWETPAENASKSDKNPIDI